MAILMKTQTEYTFDSLVELQRIVCKYMAPQQTVRKKVVHLVWGICCLGMGAYMVTHGYNAILAMLLIIPGVISMLQYVFFYQMLAWNATRRMMEEQSVNEFLFDSAHIVARQGKDSSVYAYDKCVRILETENSFYFIMEDGQGLMLDKSNLKGGSVDELRTLLESKSGKTAEKVK